MQVRVLPVPVYCLTLFNFYSGRGGGVVAQNRTEERSIRMTTHTVIVKEINVTKDVALDLLQKIPEEQYRRLRLSHVDKLARIMKAREWQDLNGDTIVVDVDGYLIDGHHRLRAVVQSESCIITLLVTGVKREAFYSLDQQSRPRGTADVLTIEGYSKGAVRAAGVRSLWAYRAGYSPPKGGHAGVQPTVRQLAKLHKKHDIALGKSAVVGVKGKKIISVGSGTFLHFIFSEINAKKADIFFAKLTTGTNIQTDSPIRFLRDRLLFDKSDVKKLSATERLALAILAWNAWKVGKPLSTLRWRRKRDGSRAFPVAV